MDMKERIAMLREQMKEKGVDVYIVPTADFHQSEYVGEHFKARKFITGFSGSAGTAVFTATEARLWVDGRYFIQAAAQIAGTTIEMMKMGEPGVPTIDEYLKQFRRMERSDLTDVLSQWARGFDMRRLSMRSMERLCMSMT